MGDLGGNEWLLTEHAKDRMNERGITPEHLGRMLAAPERTMPDPKGKDVRMYVGDGILAIVNEDMRCVITVGFDGASSADWRDFVPAGPDVPDAPDEGDARERGRPSRRAKGQAPVASRNVLDGVHEDVAGLVREQLEAFGLDYRSVRVVSPTEVHLV